MRNQSEEILECICKNPGICTEDIVQQTGWNRYLVETATCMMVENGLIKEVGHEEWGDPKFEVYIIKTKN